MEPMTVTCPKCGSRKATKTVCEYVEGHAAEIEYTCECGEVVGFWAYGAWHPDYPMGITPGPGVVPDREGWWFLRLADRKLVHSGDRMQGVTCRFFERDPHGQLVWYAAGAKPFTPQELSQNFEFLGFAGDPRATGPQTERKCE